MNLFTKQGTQSQTESHRESRFVLLRGRRVGEGWTGSLGLVDANYYLQDA